LSRLLVKVHKNDYPNLIGHASYYRDDMDFHILESHGEEYEVEIISSDTRALECLQSALNLIGPPLYWDVRLHRKEEDDAN